MNIISLFLATAYAREVETDFGNAANVTVYISNIIKIIIPFIGALALLMLIYAGYIYMTSQGNPEATGRAKDIIIGVITGILLLFLIELILNSVGVK